MAVFGAPQLHSGGREIDICACELFCTKFNFERFLFKTFFDAMRIFGGIELQTEATFPFLYIIIFHKWESFEPPGSTLGGRQTICAHGLSCMKFNFKQILFSAFFDVMHIFGCVEPQTESTFPLVHIHTSTHSHERLRCCLFTFMACIIIGGYGTAQREQHDVVFQCKILGTNA